MEHERLARARAALDCYGVEATMALIGAGSSQRDCPDNCGGRLIRRGPKRGAHDMGCNVCGRRLLVRRPPPPLKVTVHPADLAVFLERIQAGETIRSSLAGVMAPATAVHVVRLVAGVAEITGTEAA